MSSLSLFLQQMTKTFFLGNPRGTLGISKWRQSAGETLGVPHRALGWVGVQGQGQGEPMGGAASPGHTYSFFCTSATLKPLRCTGAMQSVNWPTVRRCRSQSESQARWQSQCRWLEWRRLGEEGTERRCCHRLNGGGQTFLQCDILSSPGKHTPLSN